MDNRVDSKTCPNSSLTISNCGSKVLTGSSYWQQLDEMPYTRWDDRYQNNKGCTYGTSSCHYNTQGELTCQKK